MTRGGVMKYQLSAGCGHGGLCGSTSAGSGFKEKTFPFWFITTETALVPCMQDIGSTDQHIDIYRRRTPVGYWAVASGEATWTSQAAVIVNRSVQLSWDM